MLKEKGKDPKTKLWAPADQEVGEMRSIQQRSSRKSSQQGRRRARRLPCGRKGLTCEVLMMRQVRCGFTARCCSMEFTGHLARLRLETGHGRGSLNKARLG